MSQTVNWAVVGCGWVARDYVGPAIEASRNGRVVAACDLSPEALGRFLPGADIVRTGGLDALLDQDDVDAVYVATPNDAHLGPVAAAARAGKPVLCEKPVARTLGEAERLGEAVRASGVLYATAFDQRFHPAHVALRGLIEAGDLGTVTAIRIRYACWTGPDWSPDDRSHDTLEEVCAANWRADPERAGGGAFLDLAPHGLDLTQMLLGEPLVDVAALLQRRVHDYAVDDGAALVARSASGALLSLSVAYNCPDAFPRRELEVIGTEARVLAINTMGQTPGGTLTIMRASGAEARPVAFDAAASPFQQQIEAFGDAVLGHTSFPFGLEGDLHTMRLLDAAMAEPHAHVA